MEIATHSGQTRQGGVKYQRKLGAGLGQADSRGPLFVHPTTSPHPSRQGSENQADPLDLVYGHRGQVDPLGALFSPSPRCQAGLTGP